MHLLPGQETALTNVQNINFAKLVFLGFPSFFKTSEHGFTIVQQIAFYRWRGTAVLKRSLGFLAAILSMYFNSILLLLFFSFTAICDKKNPGWHLWRCYLARMWYLFSTLSPTCQPSFPSSSLISTFVITPVHRHDV